MDSWVETDKEVGGILADLKIAGRLDSTAVFLWSDHGVSHLRGKQFLYGRGHSRPHDHTVAWKQRAGTVRDDLIEHIDVAACSLKLAGIKIPDNVQGRDFLALDYQPLKFIFAGRDRCDETVDILRWRARLPLQVRPQLHVARSTCPAQPVQGWEEDRAGHRGLHKEGKLNEQQARPLPSVGRGRTL